MADVSEGAVALAKAKLQQGQPPKNRVFYARHHTAIKWTPYRPNSQEVKRGKMGRWQELRPFGIGWQNTEVVPEAGAWVEDIINRPELATRAAPPAMDREAVEKDVAFLREAARYFANRPTDGEDRAHWSNIANSESCERIANRLSTLSADAIRQGEGWQPIETAPRDEEVVVQVGDMTFHAKLLPDAGMNGLDEPCDQWAATREGEHPPCWTGGLCWESNEDDVTSIQPRAWMPAPASHASDGGKA